MGAKVNPRKVEPADIRAYMARHRILVKDVAAARGVGEAAVRMAINADAYGRPASQALLRGILDAVNSILLEREQTACPAR